MTAAPVHHIEATGSTMDLAHRLAEEGAPAGTVVVAAEQTSGRGSRGRHWHSDRGGLWLSLVVRPATAGAALLSLRTGLAAVAALEAADAGLALALKWPNDLMWDARKLGGILCEVRWTGEAPAWAAIGIGINVRNCVAPELAGSAAALAERWPAAEPAGVLELLLPRLRRLDVDSPVLSSAELRELAGRDWLRGRRLLAPAEGVADGISADGALLVRRRDGTTDAIRSGTVVMADPAGLP